VNALFLALLCAAAFLLAYRVYGGWLRRSLLRVVDDEPTPSHELTDGVDYVPARRSVLFGHHFASIAGLGPILGPAIAVIWGWLPAVLWIVFGTIFIGGVHDFATLVLSLRNRGRSIGDITRDVVGPRARILFLLVIYFLMSLAMGVFVLVIATLFTPAGAPGARPASSHPEAVIPVLVILIVAVGMGVALYKGKAPFGWVTVIGVALSFVGLAWGHRIEVTLFDATPWIWILLAYAFLASVLPVWLLLQPRDYLNSFQLYAGMALMLAGLAVSHPAVVAPAFNHEAADLPAIFPFLFITVACGAISGFHCLVSSGTTAKQIDRACDAQAIGYGGMATEGMLAILAVLACTAGIATTEQWHVHYASWTQAGGLGPKIGAFVSGTGAFLAAVGIPRTAGTAFAAVVVVSFALTTLDSATRLLRYNIEEIGRSTGAGFLTNRYTAAAAAVVSIAAFAFLRIGGKPAGIVLWELFGTTNQLLGSLALLTVAVWLARLRRPTRAVLVPMVFLFAMTLTAMVTKIAEFRAREAWHVFAFGLLLLVLAVWLVVEGSISLWRVRRESGRAPEPAAARASGS
jgi:carbon starvation protein